MPSRTPQERALFTHVNYRFSTGQVGRDTTMYFHNGIDGGRIKRSASAGGGGGRIIYQRNCRRVFVNFHESLRISGLSEDHVQMDVIAKVEKVYRMLSTNTADDRTRLLYSLVPQIGWRVFELYGDNRCHGSAGTVVSMDADATHVSIQRMMFDDAMISY